MSITNIIKNINTINFTVNVFLKNKDSAGRLCTALNKFSTRKYSNIMSYAMQHITRLTGTYLLNIVGGRC